MLRLREVSVLTWSSRSLRSSMVITHQTINKNVLKLEEEFFYHNQKCLKDYLRVKHFAATVLFPLLPPDRCKSALHTTPNAPWPICSWRATRLRAISQVSTFSFGNSISISSPSSGLMSSQNLYTLITIIYHTTSHATSYTVLTSIVQANSWIGQGGMTCRLVYKLNMPFNLVVMHLEPNIFSLQVDFLNRNYTP